MARLTLARKIAAITLTIWKKEVPFLEQGSHDYKRTNDAPPHQLFGFISNASLLT